MKNFLIKFLMITALSAPLMASDECERPYPPGSAYYQCRQAACIGTAVVIGVAMFVGIGVALANDSTSCHSSHSCH